MWSLLKRLVTPRPPAELPDDSNGAAVLEYLGVRPIIVSWARPRQEDLAALWESCPRADWLLEIAARVRIPFEQLARAARDAGAEEPGEGWRDAEAVVRDLGAHIEHEMDGDRGIQRLHEAATSEFIEDSFERGARDSFERGARLHAEEQRFLKRSADPVRMRIEYRDVHAAIYGGASGPYR